MNDMDSGLQKLRFSKQNAKEEWIPPVTRDNTWLVPSRVTRKEDPNTPQPLTRLRHTAWA